MEKKKEFNEIVKKIIYPVFPLLAEDFLQKSGVTEGVCLDIGTGNGYMGLALAEKSNLQVSLVDSDPEMLELAKENIRERGLIDRVNTVRANAEDLPFPDNCAQLIVSRGSVFFWKNQAEGFNEIYRVLASGGMAFIGGGFANLKLMEEIGTKMKENNPDWEKHLTEKIGPDAPARFRKVLRKTVIPDSKVEVNYDTVNLWVVIKK